MNPPPASFCSARTACFCACLFLILLFGRDRLLRDPGTLWHPIVGEHILDTNSVPRHDPFSFTHPDDDWIAQQWLAEVLMALVHRLAGLDGLVLIAAALIAWTLASIAQRFLRAGAHNLPTTLLIGLTAAASAYHYIPRPHLATIALMCWLQSLLCDIESQRRRPHALLLIPPVMVLWTNLHGGALGGLCTFLLAGFAWLLLPTISKHFRVPAAPRIPLLIIGAAASLSLIAILINPYGAALPAAWLSLMGIGLLPQVIIEHAPLELLSPEAAMILSLAAIYLYLLKSSLKTGLRATWFIPLIWLALALTRVRHGPIFAVTAAITIADILAQKSPRRRFPSHVEQPAPPFPSFNLARSAAIPTALVVLALALQILGIPCPILGAGWSRLNPDHWPIAAADILESKIPTHRDARPLRVFNDMRFGGYLIYRFPQVRVFIDDRCELYREAGIRRYLDIRAQPRRVEAAACQDAIDWALIQSGTRLDEYLSSSPAWELLHRDPAASLFRRIPDALAAARPAPPTSPALANPPQPN